MKNPLASFILILNLFCEIHFFIFFSCLVISCNEVADNKKKDASKDRLQTQKSKVDALLNEANNSSNKTIEEVKKTIEKLDSARLYKNAIDLIDKLIAKDSTNQDYWLERGRLCNKYTDTITAIKCFVMATKIYPSPIAMLELANVFAETKNINALKVCNDLKKMNPDGKQDAAAHYFIGKYYGNTNNLNKAYLHLDSSINADFHLTEAFIEKGYLLFKEHKYDKALKNFELLNTLNSKNADGYYWQAKCYQALGDKAKASSFYKKSLQLDPSIEEAKNEITALEKTY
jgi:tetratricopeptide (TPR) repeat protein